MQILLYCIGNFIGTLVSRWNVHSLYIFEQHFVPEDEVNKICTISAFFKKGTVARVRSR